MRRKWRRVVRRESAQVVPGSIMRRRVTLEVEAKSVPTVGGVFPRGWCPLEVGEVTECQSPPAGAGLQQHRGIAERLLRLGKRR